MLKDLYANLITASAFRGIKSKWFFFFCEYTYTYFISLDEVGGISALAQFVRYYSVKFTPLPLPGPRLVRPRAGFVEDKASE